MGVGGAFLDAAGRQVNHWFLVLAVALGLSGLLLESLRRRFEDGEKGAPMILRRGAFLLLVSPLALLFFVMAEGKGVSGLVLCLFGVAVTSSGAQYFMVRLARQGSRIADWFAR